MAWTHYLTLETSLRKNFHFSQNPRWPPAVKGPKSPKFDPTNHNSAPHLDPVHLIWTIFGKHIQLDPRNKPFEDFFIFLLNPRWPLAVKGPKSATFYHTNHISAQHLDRVHPIWPIFDMGILLDPRNTPGGFLFSFFSKSKMAAGGQKLNLDIISAQKLDFVLANVSLSFDFG